MSEATYLLDSSLLIALTTESNPFHENVLNWMENVNSPFATCPITQGSLIRVMMKTSNLKFSDAQSVLQSVVDHPNHRFLSDSISYLQLAPKGILGHSQVTDAYLAQLAREHGIKLATLDRAQAALHADVAELVQ